jgi:hypothetical protein
MAENAENAALFVQFVVKGRGHREGVSLPPLVPSKVSSAP